MLIPTKFHISLTLLILNSCLITQTKSQDLNSIFSTYLSNFISSFLPVNEILNLNDVHTSISNITDLIISGIPVNRCGAHLLLLLQGLGNEEEWALRMIDATAKPQSGFLFGNIMQIGNYDECIKIKAVTRKEHIKGKYCTVGYEPHIKYGMKPILGQTFGNKSKIDKNPFLFYFRSSYGFCIPHECRAQDMQRLVDTLEDDLKSPLHFKFIDDYCDTDQSKPLSSAATVTAVIFSGFGLICLFSTIYDVRMHQKHANNNKSSVNIFKAFSFYTNSRKIFSTKTNKETLNCLNGLRVISMMWILFAHQYMAIMISPAVNAIELLDFLKSRASLIQAAGMAVDTFFVVSGFLVVYLFMKSTEKKVKFSVVRFYLHRLIRLTPSMGMLVLFTATLFMYMSSGPLWPAAYAMFQKTCEERWWSTMLYLNNYIHLDEKCLGQTWYLAVDTQMYFLSPIMLLPLIKWPKQTIAAMSLAIILSCAYAFEATLRTHSSLFSLFIRLDHDDLEYIYTVTHVRGSAYIVGMICGYITYRINKNCQKHSKLVAAVLWIVALATIIGVIYSYSYFSNTESGEIKFSFFNSLSRVGWSIAISLVIILCSSGYGGPINAFLCWPIFTILIRLNYSVYLLHFNVILYFQAQERTPGYLNTNLLVYKFMGSYLWTLIVSFVWTLAFESPILIIEKIIFKTAGSKEEYGRSANGGPISELEQSVNKASLSISSDSRKSGSLAVA